MPEWRHGLGGTQIYNLWSNIMQRCYKRDNEYIVGDLLREPSQTPSPAPSPNWDTYPVCAEFNMSPELRDRIYVNMELAEDVDQWDYVTEESLAEKAKRRRRFKKIQKGT